MPHRLTIRLDDDAWESLTRICEVTGVTATAYLQGVVQMAKPVWTEHGWRHPLEWDQSDIRSYELGVIDNARRIDTDRRKRG